ncbi:MAG: DUF1295 domain-containing protein [Candidatus Competibacterales bacterium]
MFDLTAYLGGLVALVGLAVVGWGLSAALRNVGVVDVLWGLFFLVAVSTYGALVPEAGPRAWLIVALVALWSLRLAGYIAWRSHGKPEDKRYAAIRRRNEPGFAWKSGYMIFGFQGLLAWIISLPLLAAAAAPTPLNLFDAAGVVLWLVGMVFEAGGDYQLARFKADPENRGKILDRGLWRYTRHPNYFGDCCVWWGFYLVALGGGGWWSVASPLLMTFLLLKFSGVSLTEAGMAKDHPSYGDYQRRTNAFFPGPPKGSSP